MKKLDFGILLQKLQEGFIWGEVWFCFVLVFHIFPVAAQMGFGSTHGLNLIPKLKWPIRREMV